jgi:hypothetical protein
VGRVWLETRSPEPRVGRIDRSPISYYRARAAELVERAGEDESIRRVRFYVPRLALFDGRELSLRHARLVVAREYGFPSWRDLVYNAQKVIDEYEHWPGGALGAAFELIRAGDVGGLRAMLDAEPGLVRAEFKGASATMLEAIA